MKQKRFLFEIQYRYAEETLIIINVVNSELSRFRKLKFRNIQNSKLDQTLVIKGVS